MRCPKCPEVELSADFHGEVEIDRCSSCSGFFLGWGALSTLLGDPSITDIDSIGKSPAIAAERDAMTATCRRCDVVMRPVETRFGVRLDNCDNCGGVFLDQGEFNGILDSLRGASSPSS